jgi:hypothetical protein
LRLQVQPDQALLDLVEQVRGVSDSARPMKVKVVVSDLV